MTKKIKQFLKEEKVKDILILLLASIFICLPLLNKKLDISYDDGIQHIARLMGTYQSLEEKQSFPVIMSNFCNGFGYSWNLFYSPFTAYIPLIFKLFGASFIACIKLFMFAMVLASGITMYFFTKEVTKNRKIALLAGIFYIFSPYRLTDMYARNALAELTSFAFLPMVFHGLYGILKQKPKREYLLIAGGALLILTHTVIAMYVAILCFIYLLTQIKKLKIRKIRVKIILSLISIIVITSFFWAPLLEHKFGAEYEVFKPGRMERTEVLIAFKLDILDLFRTPKENIMTYEIGWLSIILLLLTPIVMKIIRKNRKNIDYYGFYIFSIIAGLICVVMTLKIFPFEHLPRILKILQFSFRLLEFSSFFFAFAVSINLATLIKLYNKSHIYGTFLPSKEIVSRIKKYDRRSIRYSSFGVKYKNIVVVSAFLMIISCTFIPHLHYAENLEEERLWPAVPVTASTGRVHAGCASFEYLPCKAFENRAYIENRTKEIEVLEGNIQMEECKKYGTNLECKILASEDGAIIELPYIYYLGYNVTLEQNGETTKLQNFETDKGFVGVKLPSAENAMIKVDYTGTILMEISKIVSIIGLLLLAGVILGNILKKQLGYLPKCID